MIPILYNSKETDFTHNGIGFLKDCISCVVTEERNGIYEAVMKYPVTGQLFSEIQADRIIKLKIRICSFFVFINQVNRLTG